MKSIEPEEFYKLIAVNSGITDLQTVKDVFYGLIKTMSRELKNRQVIKLPDWGEFRLTIHKSRKMMDVNDRMIKVIPAKPSVKFVPDYKLKRYFYALGQESTVI